MSKSLKIIHLTTVHPWWDNRIYEKMVKSLAEMGFKVTYIAQFSGQLPEMEAGIQFAPLARHSGLVGRIQRNIHALIICLRNPGYIVHFHDPEIILIGLILKLVGRKVVYDVHENNLLSIQYKDYLPPLLKMLLKSAVAGLECIARLTFNIVLAERVYLKRFQRGTTVLNYPVVHRDDSPLLQKPTEATDMLRCIYTGNISTERGAFNHVKLLHIATNIEVWMVGKCSRELRLELVQSAGNEENRLHIVAPEEGIPFDDIKKFYLQGKWDIGLALFPYSPHYHEKELTKFFEYMYYGIPILASNFPVWEKLVFENNAGFVVSSAVNDAEIRECLPCFSKIEKQSMRRIVLKKYSWHQQVAKLVGMYNDIAQ